MFDVEGAKKAGYTDAEIADHLATQNKFDAAAARKSGYSDAEIIGHLSKAQAKPDTTASNVAAVIPGASTADAGAALASGAVAAPIAGLSGLGTAIAKAFGITDADPADVIHKVQAALTYEPKTEGGKNAVKAIGYIPSKIAEGADWAGGKVQQGATALGASPEVAGAAGAATNAGLQVFGPMAAAKGVTAAGDAAGTALRGGAERLMQSALKPNQSELLSGKGKAAVNTLLDEGVNVSAGGVAKLQSKISGINDKIATAIQESPAVVNKQVVGSRLQGALEKFKTQVTPTSDLAAIQKAWDEFLNHPMLDKVTPAKTVQSSVLDASGKPFTTEIPASGSNNIPVQLAQDIKQGTYRSLGDKAYGELKGADIEAQKTLARGLKEEIAKAVPEISPLNAQESKLLNALNPTERRVLMSANHNPAGLGWLTTDPVKFAGWMADRSNLFKSIVARMLNQTSELVPAAASVAEPSAKAAAIMAESEKQRRQREK